MKQTIRGWTIGLKDSSGKNFFLGIYETSEGMRYARTCKTPLEKDVCSNLFKTPEKALDFWDTCYFEMLDGKAAYTPIPLEIELTVEVKGLGFDWNGI